MGTIRAKQNRLNEAETLLVRSTVNDPRYTAARMNLAYLHLQMRQPAKAVVQLKEVLLIEPTNTDVMVMLGDAYLATNALPEAEEQYLNALDGRLDNAGALLGLAQISRAKGEIREVTIYLTRVGTLTADSKSPGTSLQICAARDPGGHERRNQSGARKCAEATARRTGVYARYGIAWLSNT